LPKEGVPMNRAKRTHRKINRNRRRIKQSKPRILVPTTADEYFAKPEALRDQWNRIAHVVSKMRAESISLRKAARQFDLDPRKVVMFAGSALRQKKNGRYAAKVNDRLLRILAVPTVDGPREVATRDSRQASLLGKYWSVLQWYLQTGDDSELRKFEDQSVTAQTGERFPLITNLAELDRLASAGVFSFESLYARSA
jgi:hypothetical protein